MADGSDIIVVGGVTILVGDVFARLAELPDDSVDVVVTSPPYWGLRDYGVDGQIGLEATLGEHLDVMVRLFREIRRVLKPSGTLWLNYGDCYATAPNGRSAADTKAAGTDDRTFRDKPFSTVGPIGAGAGHLKPKDLCMIPNRLAIALQDDGWWVRSEIIWHKPNPMPESAKDRPTSAHEKLFLLAKSERYHYDADAIREGYDSGEDALTFRGGTYVGGARGNTSMGRRSIVGNALRDKVPAGWDTEEGAHGTVHRTGRARGVPPRHAAYPSSDQSGLDDVARGAGRNKRNVWTIATRPFTDAHFATFPPDLVEPCILAGCPEGGLVLDPFGGAGTTGLVAQRLNRRAVMVELNPEYAALAAARLAEDLMGPSSRAAARATRHGVADAGPLFGGDSEVAA